MYYLAFNKYGSSRYLMGLKMYPKVRRQNYAIWGDFAHKLFANFLRVANQLVLIGVTFFLLKSCIKNNVPAMALPSPGTKVSYQLVPSDFSDTDETFVEAKQSINEQRHLKKFAPIFKYCQ